MEPRSGDLREKRASQVELNRPNVVDTNYELLPRIINVPEWPIRQSYTYKVANILAEEFVGCWEKGKIADAFGGRYFSCSDSDPKDEGCMLTLLVKDDDEIVKYIHKGECGGILGGKYANPVEITADGRSVKTNLNVMKVSQMTRTIEKI